MLVNLHSHLEGRVRPETAAELAEPLGLKQPKEGWVQALELDGPADLTVFLRKVAASYPFFGSREGLYRIAREAVQDAAADGVDYLELRFGPATHVRPDLDIDAVVRAVCEGVAQGCKDSGTAAGVVVAALRHHDHDTNRQVAEVAARHAGGGVVGFDLAGDELLYPQIAPYQPFYAIAAAAGLGLTCHAAEAAPAQAARDAVTLLGVSRIGHGAHIADDPEVLRWAADNGVVVEICPTSNHFTGAIADLADHPAGLFRDAGLKLVLGDDNPRQTMSELSAEYRLLSQQYGFTPADLQTLDETSVEHAFAEESVRQQLRKALKAP